MSIAVTGRPGPDPKIVNPTFVEPLLDLIKQGVPGYVAAESMHLRRESFFMYLRKGGHPRHAASKDYVPLEHAVEPYKTFAQDVLAAEATAHLDIIKTVHLKVQNDVNAGIKYLRARWPDEYAQVAGRSVESEDTGQEPSPVLQVSLSDFLAMQRQARDGGAADGR